MFEMAEIKIEKFEVMDVITTSNYGYDPDGALEGENDQWAW